MDTLNRIKAVGIFLGILIMVIGTVFLVIPDKIAEFLAVFVGALITVVGILRIITVIGWWDVIINRAVRMAFGIFMLIAGIFMLFNPDVTITIVGAVIGVVAIILAADRFITANKQKNSTNITPTIISGLIHLTFGVGMIYSALVMFAIIIVLIGIYLVIAGVMFTLSALFFHDF